MPYQVPLPDIYVVPTLNNRQVPGARPAAAPDPAVWDDGTAARGHGRTAVRRHPPGTRVWRHARGGFQGRYGMPFEGDGQDVPLLLATACVGDRRRVGSLVLWSRVSRSYRAAAKRAVEEWCAHEYADAQRAYVDAVLAIGASPAPSPLAMPRARARLASLCEKAFGCEAVHTFGATVLLCGKMDALTYMCVQEGKCRLCDASMTGREQGLSTAAAAAPGCQDVERAFRRRLLRHSSVADKSSAALSFTFAHVRCQMAHCRPFWSAAEYGQPSGPSGPSIPADSVWGVCLPMLLGGAETAVEEVRVRLAYRAFEHESKFNKKVHLPRSMCSEAAPLDMAGRRVLDGDATDALRYAKATHRVQAVLRTDAFGQVHSEKNVLQLQDCRDSVGRDPQQLPVCAAPRRLHMAWVLPHPAVRLGDTLMGSFADHAMVYGELQACLQERLARAEAVVVQWENRIAENADRLMDIQSELGKLPGMPSDALEFFDSMHSGALVSLGVSRFANAQLKLPSATALLRDLRWLFVPNEWERHVVLDGARAPFVASHAEKVHLLLRRARVTTLETLHGRDTFHPRHAVTLKHDTATWGSALWVLNAPLSPRARGVLVRHFFAGIGSGFAASGACYALHRQAFRAALDWLFDGRGGFAVLAKAAGDDAHKLKTADDVDRAGAACLLGTLLASLHHTSCAALVVLVSPHDETRQLEATVELTLVPRLCRGVVLTSRLQRTVALSIVELEGELSFALSEAAGRKTSQWRELESATAALLTRPPEWSAEWPALGVGLVQRAIDALLRVGFEDGAPRGARRSALRITRAGSVLLRAGPLTTAERRQKMHEQQRTCVHYPNACACRPVPTLGTEAP